MHPCTLVVQQLLRKLGKKNTVLLHLNGDSGIDKKAEPQLLELIRIAGEKNILALINSEFTKRGDKLSKSRDQFAKICKNIKIDCHILERRSIENYFTDSAIKSVFGKSLSSLANTEP